MQVSINFEDTFSVFDNITKVKIGEISLMSDGWAAYTIRNTGNILQDRIGTYKTAEDAIRAVNKAKPPLKKLLVLAHD